MTGAAFTGLVVTDALIMEAVLGKGESGAVVQALDAGCDCLLYPTNVVESVRAVQKAIDDKQLDADRIHQSIERRRRWARWAALSRDTNRSSHDESGWSVQLAEQVVHMLRGRLPPLRQPWNLVIVDDDLGGPYPAPSRDPLISALRAGGIDLAVNGETPTDGATVIALFGDIRAWKGRPGYSPGSKEALRSALEGKDPADRLIILTALPAARGGTGRRRPILCAWGRRSGDAASSRTGLAS